MPPSRCRAAATAPGPAPPRSAAGPPAGARRSSRRSGSADRGAVTVEAALALCGLTLATALAVGAVAAVAASVRCTDAARELARLVARGEPDRARTVATRIAPAGARVELVVRGDEAVAEVTAVALPVLPVRVTGRAVAVLEPGVAPDPPATAAR
jgi:hypothetical protein